MPGSFQIFARSLVYGYDLSITNDTCDLLCLDLPQAERVRQQLPPSATLEEMAEAAKGLADPTRLAIGLALREGRTCVCDLAWIVERDEKIVSHHVRLLKAQGLAVSHRDGRMVLYELTDLGWALTEPFNAETFA